MKNKAELMITTGKFHQAHENYRKAKLNIGLHCTPERFKGKLNFEEQHNLFILLQL